MVPSTLPSESSSLRDYVDESETLSKLVQLGTSILRCLPANLKPACSNKNKIKTFGCVPLTKHFRLTDLRAIVLHGLGIMGIHNLVNKFAIYK